MEKQAQGDLASTLSGASPEQKHTPGPWRYTGPDPFADYNILPPDDVTGAIGAVVNNGRPAAVVAANAMLIAAAPDLLHALQNIVMADRDGELCYEHIAEAIDVIKRATGSES